MEKIPVRTAGGIYEVYVGNNVLTTALPSLLQGLAPRRMAVVSHPEIMELHGHRLRGILREAAVGDEDPAFFFFPEGEEEKNLGTLEKGYRALLHAGITREDLLLAFGGGVVGDLAGFLAATYMRGIRYLQLPTTLMAMVDSSIGGKVGVDLPEGKNLVGAFYQPEAVLADVSLLATLPVRELMSGLAEVAKYGFLYDEGILTEMEKWEGGLPPEDHDFTALVASCAAHKARVVSSDERDLTGERALLNYGHTFGHALEAATAYRSLRHGEAVALGMIMAARLAELAGVARSSLTERHKRVLRPLLGGVRPFPVPRVAEVLACMDKDKKRGRETRFVLLEDWQAPVLVESLSGKLVGRAVEEVLVEMSATVNGESGRRRKGGSGAWA